MTSNNHVTNVGLSPGEFLAAQRRHLHLMVYDNHKVDIDGQLAAGQCSAAALTARLALERGIVIFLLEHGETALNAHNMWALFRRVAGAKSAVFRAAEHLISWSPDSDEEVRTFVERCLVFVESRLRVSPSGYHCKESFEDYTTRVRGIGRLATLLKL